MPRAPLDSVLDKAIARIVARVVPVITKSIAEKTAAQLERQLRAKIATPRRKLTRPRLRTEIVRWVADRRARRVPLFVIEATGLKTKKKIVAKFGPATFVKGKQLPRKVA